MTNFAITHDSEGYYLREILSAHIDAAGNGVYVTRIIPGTYVSAEEAVKGLENRQ